MIERDLQEANMYLPLVLPVYRSFLETELAGINFGTPGEIRLTPDKPYSARGNVPVTLNGRDAGKIVVLAFQRGDGTGNDQTFSEGQLEIPQTHQGVPVKGILPRAKTDVSVEAFFPFFSVTSIGIRENLVSLELLSVDSVDSPRAITRRGFMGVSHQQYAEIMELGGIIPDYIQRTTGFTSQGERFGDPHSIHYALANPVEATQIVGFYSVSEDGPISRAIDKRASVISQ